MSSSMAPLSQLQNANGRNLKRSYTAVTVSASSSPERPAGSNIVGAHARKVKARAEGDLEHTPSRGRGLHRSTDDMPSAAGPRVYEHYIPSFMSVYDMDSNVVEPQEVEPSTKVAIPTYINPLPHRPLQNQQEPEKARSQTHIHSHQHRQSTSTQASDSTDSSPTTTISTVDSSSLSDPSPSSSPESPITLLPLSSFPGATFGMESFQSLKVVDTDPIRPPLSDDRPMTSPQPRKPKNPKSLALNLNSNVEGFQSSEPSSPSFIKPPALKARKKPSLLSLNTGAANQQPLSLGSLGSPSVPTMLQRRSLKHSISTPQMLITPGFGPSGGMTFADRNPPRLVGASRLKESSNLAANTFTINEDHEHPAAAQMATRVPGVTVGGDTFDRPHTGEDAVSPSYPNGPILMHEPSVHLYLEPKREEAMEFDVVINVAREVKNPFKEIDVQDAKESPAMVTSESKTMTPEPWSATPDTAASMASFQTAFEVQPSSTESSPTTPKASPKLKMPEYIHVPWDHNTDVKDELWDLCQTIESRVKQGKKVLVHCQQGASRSATLIVAYGMYINQDLSANEAYARAQAKSRWVNPNMSLLFSLNDFKKIIEAKKEEKEKINSARQIKHRSATSAETVESPATPTRARGNSTPTSATRDKALAKSEAGHSMSDSTIKRLADFDFGFNDSPRNEAKHVVQPQRPVQPDPPIHRLPSTFSWEAELMSPRLTEMTGNPLDRQFPPSYPIGFESQPATTTMYPPRTFGYPRSSFFSTIHKPLPAAEDPRSPPTRGEVPIPRSIDDFL
jgi:tyrosine-protein phosphatase MSG5